MRYDSAYTANAYAARSAYRIDGDVAAPVVVGPLGDGLLAYWKLDSAPPFIDVVSSIKLSETESGVPSAALPGIHNGARGISSAEYVGIYWDNTTDPSPIGPIDLSVSDASVALWTKHEGADEGQVLGTFFSLGIPSEPDGARSNIEFESYRDYAVILASDQHGAGGTTGDGPMDPYAGFKLVGFSWDHLSQSAQLYINGVPFGIPATPGGTMAALSGFYLTMNTSDSVESTVSTDEIGIWSRKLSGPEWAELWNEGAGKFYPF